MPRNVRNFWASLDVDGRNSPLASGPVGAGGGFSGEILVRRNGEIDRAAKIQGIAYPDGTLELVITTYREGEVVDRIKVESNR